MERRAHQCRHVRARMEVLRPRVVPVQTRRSQRDVEVLKQSAEKKARAAREAQKRADRTASAARRLWVSRSRVRRRDAVAPAEANTTLFGQEVTKVSLGRRSSAQRRRSNHSGPGRGLRQFSAEPAGETGVLQKVRDKLGRDRWRRE